MTVRNLPGFRAYDLPKGGPATDGDVRDWYSIENKTEKSATVRIYDAIGGWLGTSAGDFAEEIAGLDVETIDLRLNSPGGSVFDGVAIHNALLTHKAKVDVAVDGVAASIASVIAMAGDTVTMGRGTRMMIHNPMGVVLGQAADMRKTADILDELGKDIAGFYTARAGGSDAEWLAAMHEETWYSAQEAVDAGLADAMLAPADPPAKKDAKDEAPKTFDLRAYGFRYADRSEAPDPVAAAHSRRASAALARVRASLKGAK